MFSVVRPGEHDRSEVGRSCSRLAEARDALHLGIAGLDFGDQQIGFVLCDERECALRRGWRLPTTLMWSRVRTCSTA